MYRKLYEVIGFTYNAGIHCLECTRVLFREFKGQDLEGNEIHPIFFGDEHPSTPVCEDCFESLD